MSKEVLDAGDEKQVLKAKKRGKSDRDKEIQGLQDILRTYNGREFLWRLLSECGMTSQAPIQTESMHRFEGKRDIGLWMILEINTVEKIHHTEWYPQMQSEAMARASGGTS